MSAPTLQPSMLLHVVAHSGQGFTTIPAWVTSMLHSLSTYCWPSGKWRDWEVLVLTHEIHVTVQYNVLGCVSCTNLCDYVNFSNQADIQCTYAVVLIVCTCTPIVDTCTCKTISLLEYVYKSTCGGTRLCVTKIDDNIVSFLWRTECPTWLYVDIPILLM